VWKLKDPDADGVHVKETIGRSQTEQAETGRGGPSWPPLPRRVERLSEADHVQRLRPDTVPDARRLVDGRLPARPDTHSELQPDRSVSTGCNHLKRLPDLVTWTRSQSFAAAPLRGRDRQPPPTDGRCEVACDVPNQRTRPPQAKSG
jgi:hypothetical protein